MKTPIKTIFLLASASLFTLSSLPASVSTQPVGYVTLTIDPGDGYSRALSAIGLPLYQPSSSNVGASSGTVSTVSINSITSTSAGWAVGGLSQDSNPYILRIQSGNATGRNLLISTSVDNTTDTVTIDLIASNVPDLITLGIGEGDSFELVECDTFLSLLGTPADGAIVGGSTFDDADNFWLFSSGGFWKKYYFDTDDGRWVENVRGYPSANNLPLLPDVGLIVLRKDSNPTEMIISGTVPTIGREVTVNKHGLTLIGNSFPVDVTLSECSFEQIPGWVSNDSASLADTVIVRDGGYWKKFFRNSSGNWVENVRGYPLASTFIISTGSAVMLEKKTSASADAVFSQPLPYSL